MSLQSPRGPARESDFSSVYERHAVDVYRFALYMSGDIQTAEDVTSETFARAWTGRGRIQVSTVKAYLMMIVAICAATPTAARCIRVFQWVTTHRTAPPIRSGLRTHARNGGEWFAISATCPRSIDRFC